eukprot:GFKZ01003981.1.p1 GENE.GFKZ01003981.1~~GFKZ01003981.1.p1  ORF type:complete len:328 (+),score=28.57 GFKZ01003981.1:284-1267(+)
MSKSALLFSAPLSVSRLPTLYHRFPSQLQPIESRPRHHSRSPTLSVPSPSHPPSSSQPSPETNPTSPPSLPTFPPLLPSFLSSLLSSTLGSLIGAGGGILLTPLLTSRLNLPQHLAHGTSLSVLSLTALSSAIRYSLSSQAHVPTALILSLTALLTAPLGARSSAHLNPTDLRAFFGAFLCLAALIMLLRPYVMHSSTVVLLSPMIAFPVLGLVGALSGYLSGLLGIGGGTLNVPVLVLLLGFEQHVAQGTALMAMVIPAVRGSLTHWRLGQVKTTWLPTLVAGALCGGYLGASVAIGVSQEALRVVCAVLFGGMGIKYVSGALNKK